MATMAKRLDEFKKHVRERETKCLIAKLSVVVIETAAELKRLLILCFVGKKH